MRILVANAGSSSLKLRVLEADDRIAGETDLPAPEGRADAAAVGLALRRFGAVDAVGVRSRSCRIWRRSTSPSRSP